MTTASNKLFHAIHFCLPSLGAGVVMVLVRVVDIAGVGIQAGARLSGNEVFGFARKP